MDVIDRRKQSLYPTTLCDDQIRLLQWTGSADTPCDRLCFRLIHVALDEAPSYCALSYRWQDHDPGYPDVKISCNNIDLPVGLNLFNALTRIYESQHRPLYLWVDFICIEQSNNKEKQSQLLLMPQIYRRALRVVVWLGLGTAESDAAIITLVGMVLLMKAVDVSRQPDSVTKLSEVDTKVYENLLARVQMNNDGGTTYFEPVWKLLSRDWFGRVWTVQEAAASPAKCLVLCGNQVFFYSIILDLTSRFLDAKDSDSHWIKVVDSLRSKTLAKDPDKPLRPVLAHSKAVWRMQSVLAASPLNDRDSLTAVEFLNDLRVLECSDPRDRIFTAVPFLSQHVVNSIRQRSPMTAEELYTLFAVTEFDTQGKLNCLAAAGLCYHRRSYPDRYPADATTPYLDIPSWAPDWTCSKANEPLWCLNNRILETRGKRLYEASRETRPDVSIISSDVAVVRGVIVDTVLDTNERYRIGLMPEACEADEELEWLRDHMSLMIAQVNDYVSLALKYTSPIPVTEVTQTIHKVRRALVGDMLPVKFNRTEGLLDQAKPEQIDGVFERAQADLDHWNKLYEERLSEPSHPVLSQEELEAQELEDAEWKRIYRSSPILSTCLATTLKGRRFFVTKQHRFGIGPMILMPGDKVCIFFGGDTPFIIRPVKSPRTVQIHNTGNDREQDGNETEVRYQLIGECYVNDLMYGEAMKMENMLAQGIHLV